MSYILPLGVTAQSQPIQQIDLYMVKGESRPFEFTVVDANDNPINLGGLQLEFDVYSWNGVVDTAYFSFISPTNIAITNNVAIVTVPAANSGESGVWFYELWDNTDQIVLARGKLQISQAHL